MHDHNHDEWTCCSCEHSIDRSALPDPVAIGDSMLMYGANPYSINYAVVFNGDLKTSGKNVNRSVVIQGIESAFDRYGEVSNVKFTRSGSPRFTIRIQSHHVSAAGIQNGSNIYLNTRDPRGWPISKIIKITAHEVWHYLFGGSHDYRTYVVDGKTCNALMHPYSNPPMWLFSPWEESMLVRRFGKVSLPEPEPEPEPEPPTENEIMIKQLQDEKRALVKERTLLKSIIQEDRTSLELERQKRDKLKEDLMLTNQVVDGIIADMPVNISNLKSVNQEIVELNSKIAELLSNI